MFLPLAVDRYVVFIAFPSSNFCLHLPNKVQVIRGNRVNADCACSSPSVVQCSSLGVSFIFILVPSMLLFSSQAIADNRAVNGMFVVVIVLVNFILFCLHKVVHRNVIIVCWWRPYSEQVDSNYSTECSQLIKTTSSTCGGGNDVQKTMSLEATLSPWAAGLQIICA